MTEQDILITIALKNDWDWPSIHQALIDRTTSITPEKEAGATAAAVGHKTIAKKMRL